MSIRTSRHTARRTLDAAAVTFATLVLAACGGGGGGGSSASTPSVVAPAASVAGSGPNGSCGGSIGNGTTDLTGLTLGACDSATATQRWSTAFRSLDTTVTPLNAATRSYRVQTPAPSAPADVTLAAADSESTCLNLIGNRRLLVMQSPLGASASTPYTLLASAASAYSGNSSCEGGPLPAGGPAVALTVADFGVWERNVGTAVPREGYSGGWYATRNGATPFQPTANFVAGSTAATGLATGFLFNRDIQFGASAPATLTFTAGTTAPAVVSGSISNISYLNSVTVRNVGQTAGTVPVPRIVTMQFQNLAVVNGRFSGSLTGTGAVAGQTVAGVVEGIVVRNATNTGNEIVGRFQGELRDATNTAVGGTRIVGAFGAL